METQLPPPIAVALLRQRSPRPLSAPPAAAASRRGVRLPYSELNSADAYSHVVAEGDDLSRLCARYGVTAEEVMASNPGARLLPGMVSRAT